jgi:hypothetical protein
MNSNFTKDVKKVLNNTQVGELTPGSTGRRYTPPDGVKKHNERIHRESKQADDHKNLPFAFRKPPKSRGRSTYIQCDNCGCITSATTVTVGMICPECNKFSTVKEVVCDE